MGAMGPSGVWADFVTTPARWQQVLSGPVEVAKVPGMILGLERDIYEPQDRSGRFVIAVQAGKASIENAEARWVVRRGEVEVARGNGSLSEGMVVVDFPLSDLKLGDYAVSAEVFLNGKQIAEATKTFSLRADSSPPAATQGRIPVIFPRGVPTGAGAQPIHFGVPFPKGALPDAKKLRIVTEEGKPVPAQFQVRSNWDRTGQAGVRWLGVDLQSEGVPAWWPDRKATPYFLEYGTSEPNPAPSSPIKTEETSEGIRVDTGVLSFLVRREGFNLLDDVLLNGQPVLSQEGRGGPYLVDQEGTIYRVANDKQVKLSIEESGPLRVQIRVEGWYVKDGTHGEATDYKLPTDRLGKFITRIEAYAGLSSVRVLHTWIDTVDSYSVFLKDLGVELIRPDNLHATFGVEGGKALTETVKPDGVYLLQQTSDQFLVSREDGTELTKGKRSNGSVIATDAAGNLLAVSHRDTWQRFPKELEVRPDSLRLHVWPGHGRAVEGFDPFDKQHYHQLWFAHQGELMDLRFPWETLLAVMRFTDNPSTGIYKPGGTAMGGVHSSAMGLALTSDFLIAFAPPGAEERVDKTLSAFQEKLLALPHPDWLTASQVLGPIHPYDPEKFPDYERVAQDAIFGMWGLQDATKEFGMFLYRVWHHNRYLGDGFWDPYRLYTAGHHFDPYLPWLYYARSGDPRLETIASAGMRQLTDLGIIHYNDPNYPHQEFYSRQKRLVGSTKHSNGFVLWGGDHAILGHLTSYGAIMLAYHLTGDPRYKDVVLDEWKPTLLDDRNNPEWQKAARSNWGMHVRTDTNRDNNHSTGELIDLYRMTFDPRLLVFIEPMIGSMQQNMYAWSKELQDVLEFRRTPRLREQLLEAAAERKADPKKKDKYSAIHSYAAPRFALAAWADPSSDYGLEALKAFDLFRTAEFAHSFLDADTPSLAPFGIPDRFLTMPLLEAVNSDRFQPVRWTSDAPALALPMTVSFGKEENPPTLVFCKETEDRAFHVQLRGFIASSAARLKVTDADGTLLWDQAIPVGGNFQVTIPKDDKISEYTIALSLGDRQDMVLLPITDLPGEVYPLTKWRQSGVGSFFIGFPHMIKGEDAMISVVGKNSFIFENADHTKIIAQREFKVDEPSSWNTPTKFLLPPGGGWFQITGGTTFSVEVNPLLAAISPDRFFIPSCFSKEHLTPRPNPSP